MDTPISKPPEKATTPTPERFDEILGRLRSLVERLEGGNLPLEDGLKFFEEGMDLCRRGAEILDKAEKRVEVLLSTAGGNARTAPFDAGSEASVSGRTPGRQEGE
jgi:exodeoxyribonuclease VII small subunit